MTTRIVRASLLLLCLLGLEHTLNGVEAPALEVFPKHFLLHPGEQIHYQVRVREGGNSKDVPDYTFAIEHSEIGDQSNIRRGNSSSRLSDPDAHHSWCTLGTSKRRSTYM